MTNDITKPERVQLEELETVIGNSLQTFVEIGSALLAIRDGRLYRAEHGTFEAYCLKRWGFGKAYAHRMIASAQVITNLSPIGDKPATESQARPLAKLPAADQPAAWQAATEKADEEKRFVTARDVTREVNAIMKDKEEAAETAKTENKGPTKGIRLASEAIACLSRIPKNDRTRAEAWSMVSNWLKANK